MNIILVEKDDFIENDIVLITDRRANHIKTVHNVEVGKTLKIGMINGKIGTGVLLESHDQNRIVLKTSFSVDPPQKLPVSLLLSLPRPKSLKKALSTAITMGVKVIFLINSARVEKSYWQTPIITNQAELRELSLLALEQAVDTVLPNIYFKKRFRPFVEDELPTLISGSIPIALHPGIYPPLKPYEPEKKVALAIGPEGGFVPFEIELLQKAGFEIRSMGERILRVENAVTASLAKLF